MMLARTPPCTVAIVSTEGVSVASSWRLGMVCSARMICAAVTTGSTPRHGDEPCVCRPWMSILRLSALAISPPGRSAICARGLRRGDVQAEDRRRRRIVERAVVDHRLRAARPAVVGAFLVGLEQELHRAGDLRAHSGQDLGHAHQDRDVRVVAAGMHDRHGLAEPLRLGLRRERHVDPLLDRQRIHVGTQRHHAAGLAALQDADHAGDADAGLDLDAELREVLGGERGGARLLVGKLGVLVDVAPPGDDLVLDLEGGFGNAVGELVASG